MIRFIDFKPQISEGVFFDTTAEPFAESVKDMNTWMGKHSEYNVINIETLLLPNLSNSENPAKNALRTKENNYWIQVLRVWFTD